MANSTYLARLTTAIFSPGLALVLSCLVPSVYMMICFLQLRRLWLIK
nr:hypothetical protein Iba_chr02aCG19200 [Ipomoea batatas]